MEVVDGERKRERELDGLVGCKYLLLEKSSWMEGEGDHYIRIFESSGSYRAGSVLRLLHWVAMP